MIPYVPRIDLWYNANSAAGTLPRKHRDRTQDDISRAEGWALHKVVPEYLKVRRPEDNLHRGIGVFSLKETVYDYEFSKDIEVRVTHEGDRTRLTYHTPMGSFSTGTVYTEEMRKAGASTAWIDEYVIKKPEDYRVVGCLFENIKLIPAFEDFLRWQDEIGEDGLPVTMGVRAASPMHHIQKSFLDATEFYYHYHDHPREMRALAESVEKLFQQTLDIICDSPAEAVLWGANFDDTITYPEYFKKDILPWIRKASRTLGEKGKMVFCHCDGENLGLMDLIRDSGMHVAEGVCPYPMTKVTLKEYHDRWGKHLTVFGGVPSTMLLEESTTDEEFEAYLDHVFKVVVPGSRFILGIADTTPPNAVFNRLVRIGERVEKEGRLPLEAGTLRPLTEGGLASAALRAARELPEDRVFAKIQEAVTKGRHREIGTYAQELLAKGFSAKDILKQGTIPAMGLMGERFKAGDAFIPEVLLSARAMHEALSVLEPHLTGEGVKGGGKILLGTVKGDLHDIGKNIVATILRGAGFQVRDMGINVSREAILEQVSRFKPEILGLSALLTTTMIEMKGVIEALEEAGMRSEVKVVVGGAPVNERFARDIGADGYAADAGEAVSLVRSLIGERRQV
jgi:methylmalonyl-CoA mutase cobalamin-binding domain/chain